jgi:hypothetical protein
MDASGPSNYKILEKRADYEYEGVKTMKTEDDASM